MKAVILAGGLGARISEDALSRPKPMEEIGSKPILWHILKTYSQHGVSDFVICLGRQGYVIKEFFANYFLHTTDVTFDIGKNSMEIHESATEPWKITLVNTGEDTGTAGRLKLVQSYLDGEETFCMTYGDTVSDVNITELIAFHKREEKTATLTAVQSTPRFGILGLAGTDVHTVWERPAAETGWVNGGFYVFSSEIYKYIPDDLSVKWEQGPIEECARKNELNAFQHSGFWQPMDTLRDRRLLEQLWASGRAPWKIWTER